MNDEGTPQQPLAGCSAHDGIKYLLDDFFWRNQHLWPATQSSKIFLAEALHRVGGSLFGSEWTGSEPLVRTNASKEPGTAFDRLRSAARWIVAHSDKVRTYHGRERGGRLSQAPDSVWNLGLRDPLTAHLFNCRLIDGTLIYLDRGDLEGALASPPAQASVERVEPGGDARSAGGAPPKMPEWTMFWHAVLELAVEGRLTKAHFSSRTELRSELLLMIGDT